MGSGRLFLPPLQFPFFTTPIIGGPKLVLTPNLGGKGHGSCITYVTPYLQFIVETSSIYQNITMHIYQVS